MNDTQEGKLSPPKDLSHLLSKETKTRAKSNVKRFYKYFSIPGIGQLAGGMPNPGYFPFDNLSSDVALPNRFKPTPNNPVDPPSHELTTKFAFTASSKTQPASHLLVPHHTGISDRTRNIDLATALQYGTAEGYPPLHEWLLRFVKEHMHPQIPYAGGPDIVLTCGATDGFAKALEALNNVWIEGRDPLVEKEGLLCEEFAYMNAIQTASPRGMNIVPVAIDDEGMCASGPGGLHDVLKNWDTSKGKQPHLMYTVTIGQNPTSGVLSLQRRKEIYRVCTEHDIIIIEDDPYWFLQYPSASYHPPPTPPPGTGFAFHDSHVPDNHSLDPHGRVGRLAPITKTIAPGCRLGWITAQPALVERLLRITETSTQQPSGFVQSMVAQLIVGPPPADLSQPRPTAPGRGGGADGRGFHPAGWVRWLEGLRGNYERRMNAMCDVLDEGRVRVRAGRRPSLDRSADGDEWTVVERDSAPLYGFRRPMGGMFVWVEVYFERHPLFGKEGLAPGELSKALWIVWTRKPSLVLIAPGGMFAPTEKVRVEKGYRFFRLCFAACEEDEVAGLSRRFVTGVRRFWAIRDAGTIRELLESDRDEGVSCTEEMGMLQGFC